MDWHTWHRQYDHLPSLQERLRLVTAHLAAALDRCAPGPIRLVSICAGDGRDVMGALAGHARREEVTAFLLDTDRESLDRGRAAAAAAGLAATLRFVDADASRAASYAGIAPADVLLLSGFLGHLRTDDVPGLLACLPMLCRVGGVVIWSRHLVLNQGRDQVPAIRELLRRDGFEEAAMDVGAPDGFAVGSACFRGTPRPLDTSRVLFEFVGLDLLMGLQPRPGPATPAGPAVPDAPPRPSPAGRGVNLGTALEPDGESPPLPGSGEPTIPAAFAETARRWPSQPALGAGTWRPTYAELDALTDRLAGSMQAHPGAAGDRVAILMQHDGPLVAAALATLKAGRAVVILNPSEPAARLQHVLADAEPGLLVTDAANRTLASSILREGVVLLRFDEACRGSGAFAKVPVAPDDMAWLIYTSGSTGRPKGVMQTHRNILHNVRRLSRGMNLGPSDGLTLLASPSSGQGTSTVWCAWLNGAALCPFAIREAGLPALTHWLNQERVTVLIATASVFRQFTALLEPHEFFPRVRLVRVASEPATASDLARVRRHFPAECLLLNSYSSSEAGNITQHPVRSSDPLPEGRLPIGREAEGMTVLLLDDRGNEVGAGEPGEVTVRSRFLSPGYWRNPELTAQRFSGGRDPGALRSFRSGDRARRLADGALVFLGRADAQVKVNGYRLETSEVEEVLTRQPHVDGAVVSARESASGNQVLLAHVVLRRGHSVAPETLRRAMRRELPAHMVPSAIVFVDHFPLTPHGKIDRQALPAPPSGTEHRRGRGLKPRDIVERNLVKIWQSVLRLDDVGRDEDFFDLGGTSLQAMEVLAAIEEVFNVALPASALVEHSTVETLTPLLSEHAVFASPQQLVALRSAPHGRPLFFIHSGQGDVLTYGVLARRLAARPMYGLQAVGLQGEAWPLSTVEAMADSYLPGILEKDPTGPYLFAATCMGGMVALELAQRLVRRGRTVALLAMMDVPVSPYGGSRAVWHQVLLDPVRDAFRILRWRCAQALRLSRSGRRLPAYRRFVASMTGVAFRRYRPSHFPGKVTLLLTADTAYAFGDRRRLMAHLAADCRVITVPGLRPGLFVRPGVEALARELQRCLEEADAIAPPDHPPRGSPGPAQHQQPDPA